jgi:hypothetical protein
MSLGVMTTKHPRWTEFFQRLEGPEACNFRKDGTGETVWSCGGGRSKAHAIKILLAMDATVAEVVDSCFYFESHGGFCDCEILFNVPNRTPSRLNPARRRKPK